MGDRNTHKGRAVGSGNWEGDETRLPACLTAVRSWLFTSSRSRIRMASANNPLSMTILTYSRRAPSCSGSECSASDTSSTAACLYGSPHMYSACALHTCIHACHLCMAYILAGSAALSEMHSCRLSWILCRCPMDYCCSCSDRSCKNEHMRWGKVHQDVKRLVGGVVIAAAYASGQLILLDSSGVLPR